MLAGVAFAAASLTVVSPAPASADQVTVSGQLKYETRDCYGSNQRRFVPVPAAKLELFRRGGDTQGVYLSPSGKFSVKLNGRGKAVGADLVLEDQKQWVSIDVQGATTDPTALQVSTLKDAALHSGRNGSLTLTDDSETGPINALSYLLKSAQVAHAAWPKVPGVKVLIHNSPPAAADDVNTSYYSSGDRTIHLVKDATTGQVKDLWEPFTLAHEYGHHVLMSVAPLQGDFGAKHYANEVYPNRPGLAYSEGFASAFAATVLGRTDLGYNCPSRSGQPPEMRIGETPALPKPTKPRYAQFNETASAAAMWKVISASSLHDFLGTMVDYRDYAGHYPDDMRQVREALVELEHGSASQHTYIDRIFGDQNLRWGILGTLVHEPQTEGPGPFGSYNSDEFYEVILKVTGPGGTCETARSTNAYGFDPSYPSYPGTPGPALTDYPESPQYEWDAAMDGALGYVWQDECLVESGDGYLNPQNGLSRGSGGWSAPHEASFQLLFPYVQHAAQHKGSYTVSAEWRCVTAAGDSEQGEASNPNMPPGEQEKCYPGDFVLQVDNGILKGNDDKVITNSYDHGAVVANDHEATDVTLPVNKAVPLITWNANGVCHVDYDNTDCGTAYR